jgi:nickel transport protein
MTRTITPSLIIPGLLLALNQPLEAHTVNYQVENKGLSTRVFYDVDDPASYSAYEIYGPGDKLVFQKGRSDRNGFVSFLPDRQGLWTIKVMSESEHGIHAVEIKIKVDQDYKLESFEKPLVAKHLKGFIGISILLAGFGLWALITSRRPRGKSEEPEN